MSVEWFYYNHALLPKKAPHEEIIELNIDRGFWKGYSGKPILARWTSEFDSPNYKEWWYTIKDTPFDINELKAKRRYEITKGKKNFSVERINPQNDITAMYEVLLEAYSSWPEKYRPNVSFEQFEKQISEQENAVFYGGYDIETKKLVAFAILNEHEKHADFSVLRVNPKCERLGINAAMVEKILVDYNTKLENGYYICDGARSIRHETAFQDYLEKYFGFRKAYCKLNIAYNGIFNLIIRALYPFRKIINGNSGLGSSIAGVLKMEEIRRKQ